MTQQTDFEAVRDRHSLMSVVERMGVDTTGWEPDDHVTLSCLMPDHADSDPSMLLYLDDEHYTCKAGSCGSHGDVIQLVRDAYGVRVRDAVRLLDRPGPLPAVDVTGDPHARPRAKKKSIAASSIVRSERPDLGRTPEARVRAATQAAWRYYTLDKLHARAVAYLGRRGIDVTPLEAVSGEPVAGHTPHQGWPPVRLAEHLRAKGFTDDELVDAALIRRYPDTGNTVDAYRDRVLLPVRDDAGRVTALIGRYVGHRSGVPKYLNPARTAVYDKQVNLYRPTTGQLDPAGQVVVVEGTLDALHLAAVAAAAGRLDEFAPVTSSGLALRPEQLATVLALSPRPIVLAADGDAAGAKANLDWATSLLRAGRQSAIVTLPPDPDTPAKSDGTPAGYDPDTWLHAHGEEGLLAFTRSGGEAAPADEVRPRPSHRAIAERLMSEAKTGKVLATTLAPLAALHDDAARRYAVAAADVLAPEAVSCALAGADVPQQIALSCARFGAKFGAHESVWTERVSAELERRGHTAAARQLPVLVATMRAVHVEAPTPTPSEDMTPTPA